MSTACVVAFADVTAVTSMAMTPLYQLPTKQPKESAVLRRLFDAFRLLTTCALALPVPSLLNGVHEPVFIVNHPPSFHLDRRDPAIALRMYCAELAPLCVSVVKTAGDSHTTYYSDRSHRLRINHRKTTSLRHPNTMLPRLC